jgi:hypothetical protein
LKDIKIAFIIFELGSGGQERQMSYTIHSLIREGLRPLLFIWSQEKEIIQDYGLLSSGISVIRLNGNFFSKIYKIRSSLKTGKIQIFHSWSLLTNIILAISTIGSRVKTVGALRGELFGYYIDKTKKVGSLKTIIQLIFLKNIICNSYSALEDMKKLFNTNPFIKKNLFFSTKSYSSKQKKNN